MAIQATLVVVAWLPGLSVADDLLRDDLLPADVPIAAAVDHYVNQQLQAAGVQPAERADDATLLRRTMLDLVGRIPTASEARQYLASQHLATEKHRQLVERLMGSPEFVRHQVNQLDAMLMADGDGSLAEYFETAVAENRSWDRIFRELLLVDVPQPTADPRSRFLKARVDDLDRLANDASVLFFGVNVSCAQCHDHPLVPEWTQEHFYGMKSFFARTFQNGDFIGERDYGLVNYTTTSGEQRDARLMFLTGTVLDEPESPEPDDEQRKQEKELLDKLKESKQPPPAPAFSRRAQLAEVALRPRENTYFARSLVNRLWYRLFGYGLVMPLDQMHPENPPSHPELLAWLERDTIAHGYDLQRLIRGLVSSDAYGRSSRWSSEQARPRIDLFAVANVRPLSRWQYALSLQLASRHPDQFARDPSDEAKVKAALQRCEQASRPLADQLEQPGEDFQVGVTEALLFSNSELVMQQLLTTGSESLIDKLLSLEDPEQAVQTAVWNACSRPPTEDERDALVAFVNARQDRLKQAYQHLVWALLTSAECRFNY